MQDDQQLPRAPPALIYSICFSSLSAVTGSCLSERDLGFRGSDTCQMSFGVCAAKIVPLDILLLFFFSSVLCCTQTTFSIWVAQAVYSSTVCMMIRLQHHALDDPTTPSAQSAVAVLVPAAHPASMCHYVHLTVIFKRKHLGFCLVTSHFQHLQFSERVIIQFELVQCWGAGPWNIRWLCCHSRQSDISFNYWSMMRLAGIRGSYINSFSPFSSLILLSCYIHSYGTSHL